MRGRGCGVGVYGIINGGTGLTCNGWRRSSRLGGAQHVVVGALDNLIAVPRSQEAAASLDRDHHRSRVRATA
jgi:hypothetical protein